MLTFFCADYTVKIIPKAIKPIALIKQNQAYLFTTIGAFLSRPTSRAGTFSSGNGSSPLRRRLRQPANRCPFSKMKNAAPIKNTKPNINQKLATAMIDCQGKATSPATTMTASVINAQRYRFIIFNSTHLFNLNVLEHSWDLVMVQAFFDWFKRPHHRNHHQSRLNHRR